MALPERITNLLEANKLLDVIFMGYIWDDDGVKCFTPVTHVVFLSFEGTQQILRCKSVEQYWKLELSLVDRVGWDVDFEMDPDDEFCTFSAKDMFTRYEVSARFVDRVRVFYDDECDVENGIVKSAEFCLERAGCIFFDPNQLFGIKLGTEQQRDEWLDDWADRGPFKEYVWERSQKPDCNS